MTPETERPDGVISLDNAEIETIFHWPLPPAGAPAPHARLSFDALAKLFAAERTWLVDEDIETVDTP